MSAEEKSAAVLATVVEDLSDRARERAWKAFISSTSGTYDPKGTLSTSALVAAVRGTKEWKMYKWKSAAIKEEIERAAHRALSREGARIRRSSEVRDGNAVDLASLFSKKDVAALFARTPDDEAKP